MIGNIQEHIKVCKKHLKSINDGQQAYTISEFHMVNPARHNISRGGGVSWTKYNLARRV